MGHLARFLIASSEQTNTPDWLRLRSIVLSYSAAIL